MTRATAASLHFSTAAAPPSGQSPFEAYHDLYAPVADAVALGDTFAVAVDAHKLEPMLVFDRRMRGVAHRRPARRVARDGYDHFTAQLALDGDFRVETPGREGVVGTGQFVLIDMSRPMETRVEAARVLTLSIPRAEIEAVAGDARGLHGAIIPRDRAFLFAGFMRSVLEQPVLEAPPEPGRLARITGDLLGLSLSGRAAGDGAALDSAAAAVCRTKARGFIDANLSVDPQHLARAIGVSRSVLYRAFEPAGGVAAYIRGRRLLRLRALLADPGEIRPIGILAGLCGFAGPSEASRVFGAEHGMTPSAFRKLRREGAAATGDATAGLARWWRQMR